MTALLMLIGVVLLLPGLCAVILSGSFGHLGSAEIQLVSACAVAAIAGIALIIWAGRRQ